MYNRGWEKREGVSILARPEGRALPSRTVRCPAASVFQSSPGPKAGRCRRGPPCRRRGSRVSILARPEGRALPQRGLPPRRLPPSFNPRPARRPGAASAEMAGARMADAMFQSSPGPKAGRCVFPAPMWNSGTVGFNPRPARRPGAASRPRRRQRMPVQRFNPRPARRPGAAMRHPDARRALQPVSILARPEGRALLPGS